MARFEAELRWIDSQRERMVALLERWVGMNTGSYNVAGLGAFVGEIEPVLRELTGDVQALPLDSHAIMSDRGEVLHKPLGQALRLRADNFERRGNGPGVLLGIHYDTVFAQDDAFQRATHIDADTMRGPGACDAKGGILVMLFALMALERSAWGGNSRWEMLLNPDEELGSPSSADLWTEAARRNDLALLFEPALPDGALVSARKGSANYTLVVRGRAAHAGRDFAAGRNAIHALAGLVKELADLQREIAGIQVNVGFIHGGGAVNVVPDLALAHFNIRVENDAQQVAVGNALREISSTVLDGIEIRLHRGSHCLPKPLNPPAEALLNHLKACAELLNMPLAWRPTGGVCDGNRVAAAGIPVVDSLGVRGGGLHTDAEFMLIDSLAERAKLTALFLMRLAAGEITVSAKQPEEMT